MTIREAKVDDLARMSALCLRSKAQWGYDNAFMAACTEELSVTEADLGPGLVLWDDGGPRGVAHVVGQGDVASLEKLFIEPTAMGQGFGRALFHWAVDHARRTGAKTLELHADPFAEEFYMRLGMTRIGDVASATWPNRFLPHMQLVL